MTKSGKHLKESVEPRAARTPRPTEDYEAETWRPPARTRKGGRRRQQQSGGLAYVLLPALVVVALGMAGIIYFGAQQNTAQSTKASSGSEQAAILSDVNWPTYVTRGPADVREAYQFAVARADVLQYMPCYCGCGVHDGHKSNLNCFVGNPNQGGKTIAFDSHGANCDMCVQIARDTKRLLSNGKSLKEIRAYVDQQYGSLGPATDTPQPPVN